MVLTDTRPAGLTQGASALRAPAPRSAAGLTAGARATVAAGAQATVSVDFSRPRRLPGGPRHQQRHGRLTWSTPTRPTTPRATPTWSGMDTGPVAEGPPWTDPGDGVAPDTAAAGDHPGPLGLVDPILTPAGYFILLGHRPGLGQRLGGSSPPGRRPSR